MHHVIAKLITSATKNLSAGQTAQITFQVKSPKKHVKVLDERRLVVFGSDTAIMTLHLVTGDRDTLEVLKAGLFERGSRSLLESFLRDLKIVDIVGEGIRFHGVLGI